MNARVQAPALLQVARLTVGASDALEASGNVVSVVPGGFEITMLAPPAGLVLCSVGGQRCLGLRLATETPFRHEQAEVQP